MNKQRRRRIADLTNELDTLLETLTDLRDEEQEAFDNMPESLQDSERGQDIQDGLGTLDSAVDELGSIVDETRNLSES